MALFYDDTGGQERELLERDAPAIEIFLDPGDYFVGDAIFQVRTLLGSCVSMILWHPRLQFGAMSHFLLSHRKCSVQSDAEGLEGKYADEVLQLMMRELADAGVPVGQCQAKVFGGGNMFPHQALPAALNVGRLNGQAALALLQAHGLTVVAQDLYGEGHREVIFNVRKGEVWVRQVTATRVSPEKNWDQKEA